MTESYESDKGILARLRFTAASAAALLMLLAPAAQEARTQDASSQKEKAGETVSTAPEAATEPLLREYKGVTLGLSTKDARAKLGKSAEKSEAMDFYVFSERERARVYYQNGKVSAIIATYIGKDGGAPTPASVLGADIEAKPDGSLYKLVAYPRSGYWVAYSRTAGDSPMVMITMQKTP